MIKRPVKLLTCLASDKKCCRFWRLVRIQPQPQLSTNHKVCPKLVKTRDLRLKNNKGKSTKDNNDVPRNLWCLLLTKFGFAFIARFWFSTVHVAFVNCELDCIIYLYSSYRKLFVSWPVFVLFLFLFFLCFVFLKPREFTVISFGNCQYQSGFHEFATCHLTFPVEWDMWP